MTKTIMFDISVEKTTQMQRYNMRMEQTKNADFNRCGILNGAFVEASETTVAFFTKGDETHFVISATDGRKIFQNGSVHISRSVAE